MTTRMIWGKRGSEYGNWVSEKTKNVLTCTDDELMMSVSHKVLQAREKHKATPGLPTSYSYTTDTVAIQDEGFRPIVLFAPYVPGKEQLGLPHYCIFTGTEWADVDYSTTVSDLFVEVTNSQIIFYNGRYTGIAWWGPKGDRVAALVIGEKIEDETPLTNSATRVYTGRRADGVTLHCVTKKGYNANVAQVSKNVNFSSELETLDVQATGTYENLGRDLSVSISISPALPRLPVAHFMFRPHNSDGEVNLGIANSDLDLDWRWGYDFILSHVRSKWEYSGVQGTIEKDKIKFSNYFFDPIDIAYVIFDNYWEPAP